MSSGNQGEADIPRYALQRTFPEGLHIQVENGGADLAAGSSDATPKRARMGEKNLPDVLGSQLSPKKPVRSIPDSGPLGATSQPRNVTNDAVATCETCSLTLTRGHRVARRKGEANVIFGG
jgi:hypothetical protein